ncbi:cannabidiolic acid synthase-like [Dorcoceras hygrometricum]|uniref:Cannabidiolic acid synthase-like n=1 Tax=Dorcoceras hygrometricum TaxID=472368 RepID=A0A2Z7D2C9_9LAMI|nr:cannabidiolic acid synthase-like [Dorcoceras hygrometricum]
MQQTIYHVVQCMRTEETGGAQRKQHSASYQNRSGPRTCERMGVTRPLDHTRYQKPHKTGMAVAHVREWELPSSSITRSTRKKLEQRAIEHVREWELPSRSITRILIKRVSSTPKSSKEIISTTANC